MSARKKPLNAEEVTKPQALTVDFRESADGMAIIARQTNGGAGRFLLLWLIGWTVGCVFLVGLVSDNPSIGNLAFAVPFWAAWLAVSVILIWTFFGTETLLIRHDKVLFLRKAIMQLTTREVSVTDVTGIRSCRSRHQENDEYLWGIEVATVGRPIRFGFLYRNVCGS